MKIKHKNQTVTNAPQPHEAENGSVLRCLPKVLIEKSAEIYYEIFEGINSVSLVYY